MHMFINSAASSLRQISSEELLHLGTRQIVYLKSGMCDGEMAFRLYGADGTDLETFDSIEDAVQTVDENGLSFASIH
jgi:hypothetical protein